MFERQGEEVAGSGSGEYLLFFAVEVKLTGKVIGPDDGLVEFEHQCGTCVGAEVCALQVGWIEIGGWVLVDVVLEHGMQ